MSMPAELMRPAPSLEQLLRGYADAPDIAISGIASDSRLVKEGYLFIACAGINSHGLDYLDQAIAAGARAIAWDESGVTAPESISVPSVAVQDLGMHLGDIANRFYGNPSSTLGVVGVTGTNGKTTVAWMIAQCLQRLGKRCGYIGTLSKGVDEVQDTIHMTTPAAIELHDCLANFAECGATHAALEVSSHALSQNRIDGVGFDAVLFTNMSRDHLDYHGDMRAYFESKARLFTDYDSRTKIVNLDSEYGAKLAARCGPNVVVVSTEFDRGADERHHVFVRSVVLSEYGSTISVTSSWGDARFTLRMPGDYNIANAVTVLAYLLSLNIGIERSCDALEQADAPPGRMQRVDSGGTAVFVDYAHTPDAIESALRALRPHCHGKLWCVFGCGGDRDAGKRSDMGRLAECFADEIIITNDNPRSEAPQDIIGDIVAGLTTPGGATIIEDRAAAIGWAISNAAATDVVLIAGKGHETYQAIGDDRLPFSDYAVALAALRARSVEK